MRVYVESEVGRARSEVKALYQIIRRLSGRLESTCKSVKDEAGVSVRTAEEEMRW